MLAPPSRLLGGAMAGLAPPLDPPVGRCATPMEQRQARCATAMEQRQAAVPLLWNSDKLAVPLLWNSDRPLCHSYGTATDSLCTPMEQRQTRCATHVE